MIGRASFVAGAVALALVGPALALDTVSGTVKWVDDTGRIIEFTDGRIAHLGYDVVVSDPAVTAVMVDGRPIAISSVRPGMYVVVPSDTDAVSESSPVVTASPTVVAEPTIRGTVTRVDPGTKTIVLSDGRVIQTNAVLIDGRPIAIASVQPGMYVVVPADAIVVSEPARVVVTPSTVAAERTIRGTVTRVDPGTKTIVLSDDRVIQTNGDTVIMVADRTVEVTEVHPGDTVVITTTEVAPSALPRAEVTLMPARVLIVREPEAV